MAENKQVIIDFQIEASEALQATVALTDKLNQLKETKKQLEQQLKQDSGNKQLKEQLVSVNAQIGATSSSLRGYQKELTNVVKAGEAENKSLEQQRAVLANLTSQWDRLSESERNSTKGVNLKAQIDTTMSAVKGLEESTDRFQRNVGNYSKSAKQALRELTIELQNLAVQNSQTQGEIKAQEAVLQSLALTVGEDSQQYQQAAEKLNQLKTAFNDSKTAMAQMEQQAGQMRDTISDVNTRINSFANDQQKIAAAQEGVQVLAGSYALLQTSMKALGVSSESLLQVWAKVELVQKSMNALMTISKALNKDSNLMIVLKSQLTKTQTAYQVAYNTALTATNTAEGVGVKLAPKIAAGFKGIGAAIKSIPGVAWITAITAALTVLIPKLKSTNKELDNTTKGVKGVSVSATEATVKLQLSVGYLKTCKEGTEQWKGAISDVATQLGVSEKWLKAHINDIDTITQKWVESQLVMAQVQSQIAKIVDLENQKGDIQNQFQQLRKLMSQGAREAAIQFAQDNFGDSVVKTVKAYFANLKDDKLKDSVLASLFGGKDDITKSFIQPIDDAIAAANKKATELAKKVTQSTKTSGGDGPTGGSGASTDTSPQAESTINSLGEFYNLLSEVNTKLWEGVKGNLGQDVASVQREMEIFDTKMQDLIDELTADMEFAPEDQKGQYQEAIDAANQLRAAQMEQYQTQLDGMQAVIEKGDEQYQQTEQLIDQQKRFSWTLSENQKQSLANAKTTMDAVGMTAGAIQGLLGAVAGDNEEMQKYMKAAGMVQILMSMGVGIAQAIQAGSGLMFPANLAAIATGVAAVIGGVTSAINLFKQTETAAAPKFATGGLVTGPGTGTSDSITARLSNGESVMTARATQQFAPLLSAMNVAGGGAPITQTGQNNTLQDMFESAFANMPAPVVSVKEITNTTNRVRLKESISKNN